MNEVAFTVHGMPVPQGSKRSFTLPSGRSVLVDSNHARLRSWRANVASAAAEAMSRHRLFLGPIALKVEFGFPRPASHFRRDGSLKPSAPAYHIQRPDIDKLMRALLDAMTGVVFRDDAQVFQSSEVRLWAESARATVHITQF